MAEKKTEEKKACISVEDLDPHFKYEVAKMPGGENIKYCFTCGTCTAGCPVRQIDERYNPRRIIRMILLGMRDEVLKSDFIWLCSTCYTCQERCPQDVKITDLMNAVKNLAVKEGYIPPVMVEQLKLIKEHGKIYEIDEFDNKKREKAGLPRIPSKIEDVKKVYTVTHIEEIALKKAEK